MTTVAFYFEDELLSGFHIVGHSTANAEDELGRIVCSAVSSAAYMTANTITEIVGARAEISVNEERGEMTLILKDGFEDSFNIMSGFMLHIKQLSNQYPDYIALTTEV
ncbi:MAG: ribosomal-processing cysteine protease Prp [Clostridia bacterium]|nr:ribosomal-processing cysteine protease Prp [Clostridia bacterium]